MRCKTSHNNLGRQPNGPQPKYLPTKCNLWILYFYKNPIQGQKSTHYVLNIENCENNANIKVGTSMFSNVRWYAWRGPTKEGHEYHFLLTRSLCTACMLVGQEVRRRLLVAFPVFAALVWKSWFYCWPLCSQTHKIPWLICANCCGLSLVTWSKAGGSYRRRKQQ